MGDVFSALADVFTSPTMYSSAVRLGGFLAFAAMGELVAEKAGTINISVEGSLLAGAFTGAVGYTIADGAGISGAGAVWFGLAAGVFGGVLVALIQANMSHRLTADQFVVGLTANVLVLGLAGYLNAHHGPGDPPRRGRRDSAALGHSADRSGPLWADLAHLPAVPADPAHLVAAVQDPLGSRGAGGRGEPAGGRRVGDRRQQAPPPGHLLHGNPGRARRCLPRRRSGRHLRHRRRRGERLHRHRRGVLRGLATGRCSARGLRVRVGRCVPTGGARARLSDQRPAAGGPALRDHAGRDVLHHQGVPATAALSRPFIRGLR